MSKEKGDVKGEVVEKDKDLKSTKSVNDGNDSKSCVVESSNPKSTKEKISVYSLCVPIYTRNFVSKDIFSSHITLVKNGLKDFSYLPKMKNNRHTSYSMMSAIMDGFNIVFYSQTHKYMPRILHQSQGIRVILRKGMDVIFNGHLVHGGGKSRIN